MTELPTRLPPHNQDAERSVLGAILIKSAAMDDVGALLHVDDFFFPGHRAIFEVMAESHAAGVLVDIVGVADELRKRGELPRLDGQESYLLALTNAVPHAENVRHYAKIVRDCAVLRRVIKVCAEAASRAHGDVGADELLSDLRASLASLETGSDVGPQRLGDTLSASMDLLESKAKEPSRYVVMSGVREFDRVTGGHKAGQLIIVAARPGMGKTSWALSTSVRVATSGIPALVFSLEMKRQEITERALSFSARVTGNRLTNGDLDMDAWKHLRTAEKKLAPIPLWLDDRKLACGVLCAEARRWRARHAKGQRALVVIDYLGLVRSDDRSGNRALEVGAMSRAFKGLAGDLDCPVMLVAQLNRESVKGDGPPREPKLSDLRDSGEIEADADMVVFPFREDVSGGESMGPVPAQLIVAKHRNGPVGSVDVDWEGRFMAFYDRERNEGEGWRP